MQRISLVLLAACGMWATLVAQASVAPATATAPRLLSETGLYLPGSLDVDSRNRPFSPQYPLWSDGALKTRWVYLPPGTAIDGSDPDGWEFPVGTRFWKEFTFSGRKVETRLLWKSAAAGWTFASYVWNEAQTDAVLAPEDGIPWVAEIAPGRRHSIPGVADCRACHDSPSSEALGFTALQLSTDRDLLAPHAEPLRADAVTLRTLVEERLLTGHGIEQLVSDPPRIRAENPVTRAALGYLAANCGSCHYAGGSLAHLGLDFRQRTRGPLWTDVAVLRHLDRRTDWQQPGAGEQGSRLIVPGAPEHSALIARVRSRRPSSQMPPLGTVMRDDAAIDLLTRWVRDDLACAARRADAAGSAGC